MMPNPVGSTPFSALLIPPEYHDDVLHGGAELIEKEMRTPSALALPAGAAGSRESTGAGSNNNKAAAAYLSPPHALSYHLHILDAEERHEVLRMHQQQGLEQFPPASASASGASSSSPPAAALLPPAAAEAVCQVHERYLQRLSWASAFLQRDRCFSRWLTCPEDPMLWPSAVSENWLEVTEAIRVLREVEGTGEEAEEGQGRTGSRGLDAETMALAEALTTTRAGAGAGAVERQKTATMPAGRRYLLALQEAWKILHAEATRPGVYPLVPVSVAGTLTPYHSRRSPLGDEATSPSFSSLSSSSSSAAAASLVPLKGDLSAGGAAVYTRGKASALRANCHSDETAPDRPHRPHGVGGGDPLQAVREKECGGGGGGVYLLQMPHHPRLFFAMEILELPLTSKAMLQLVHHFYEQNSVGTDMKMITSKDHKSPAAAGVRGLWLALVGLHRSRFVQSSSAGPKQNSNNNNNNNGNIGTHGSNTLMIVRSSGARPSLPQQHRLARTSSSDTSSLLPLMGSAQDFLQSGWCGWSTQFSHSAAATATSRGGARSNVSAEHSGRTHDGGASGVHKSSMGGGPLLTATEWATRQYLQQQQAAALLGLDSKSTGSAHLLLEDGKGAGAGGEDDDDGEPEAFLGERVRAAHQSAGGGAAAGTSMIGSDMDKGVNSSNNNNNNNNNNNSVPHCIRLQSGVYATVLHLLHAVCLFITEIEEDEEDGAANRATVSDSRPSLLSSSTSQPDGPHTPRALSPPQDAFTAYKRSPADWVLLDHVVAPPGSEMRSSLEQQLHMSLSQAWRRGLLRVFTRRRCSCDRSRSSAVEEKQQQSSRVAAADAAAPPSLEDVWAATRQSFWSPFIVAHHQAQQGAIAPLKEEASQAPVPPRPAPITTTTTSTMTTDQWVESYCAVPPQWLSLPPSSSIALSIPTTLMPAAVSSSLSSSPASASKEAPRTLKLFVHAVRIRTRYNPFLLFHGDRVERGWKGRVSVLRALKRRREELPEAYEEQQLLASLRRRARGETPAMILHTHTNRSSTNTALSSPPPPCSLVGTELREAVRSTLMKVLAAEPLSKADLLQHTQMRKYAASPFFEPVVQALLKEGRSSQRIQYKGRKYELSE